MNIIVTHTPIVTTLEMQQAYEPLVKYNVNIFAFDFYGTGKSKGTQRDFSRKSIVKDLETIIAYIEKNFTSNIHLYGNTGIGGMMAQYYAATSQQIKSFAQFNCVVYKDTARGMGGNSYPLTKIMCHICKILPEFHISLDPPKYTGYRHEEDNAHYKKLEAKYPNIWKTSSKLLLVLMEIFMAKDSTARNSVAVPTLVFKVLHDRYMPPKYFDDYFQSLTCEKKLVEINGVHNSYYIDSDEFCKHTYDWFVEHSS